MMLAIMKFACYSHSNPIMMDSLIGKSIGGCEILQKLGEGGMGVAYKAHHIRLDRVVVIKFLYPKVAARPGAIADFQKEAQAAARLEHPRITQVYDVGSENNLHFIVMQFIDGETVEDLLARSKRIAPLRCLQIIKASLEGLHEAHRHGIVHRDIKPSNILLGKDGSIRLADFGLALKADASGKAQGSEIIGTPLYMSPEQIWGLPVDGRCDIYSMGATYYHMISGAPPYFAPTPQDIVAMHVNNPIPDVRTVCPDVSNMCADVLMKMMAKKPEQRFKDVPELLQALNSPAMVVGDANEMMAGAQMLDLGIKTPPPRTMPAKAAPPYPSIPPVPVPGGAEAVEPNRPTPLPETLSTEKETPSAHEETAYGPASWRPLGAAVLWMLTGASAYAAGTQENTLYLAVTGLLAIASCATAASGIGLLSLISLTTGLALLYLAGTVGVLLSFQKLTAAPHVLLLPAAAGAAVLTLRLSVQSRKSRMTLPAILFSSLIALAAAFLFAIPTEYTWEIILDEKTRHPKAFTFLLSTLCCWVMILSRNRSANPKDSSPALTFIFLTTGWAAAFFAGAAHYTPPVKSKTAAIDHSVEIAAADADSETMETPSPSLTPEAVSKEGANKSDTRRMIEHPFKNISASMGESGSTLLSGLLFLLLGAFIYWEDARIFEQEKGA